MKLSYRKLMLVSFTSMAITTVPVAFAGDTGGCESVYQAMLKQAQSPNHQYIQHTRYFGGTKSTTSEYIATPNASYVQVGGKWRRSPMSQQENVTRLKENWAEKKIVSCRVLREEAVEGEAAIVYAAHEENDSGKSDSQIWISKRRGLPLKLSLDQWVSGGAKPDSHMAARYVYENVNAPPGCREGDRIIGPLGDSDPGRQSRNTSIRDMEYRGSATAGASNVESRSR